jgi:enoyl-[acyl-carrier protein] reductase III
MLNSQDAASKGWTNGGAQAKPSPAEIEAVVIDTLAELTRYPRNILNLQADLDQDLGIDSLKRMEIVTELFSRLGQKVSDDLQELGEPPRTVGELVTVAVEYVAKATELPGGTKVNGKASTEETPPTVDPIKASAPSIESIAPRKQSGPSRANGSPRNGNAVAGMQMLESEIETIVIDTLVELTKYPRDILNPDARFDEDLGIDSLKRIEIVTSLLGRLDEMPSNLEELGELPQTIRELTALAVAHLNGKVADVPTAKPEAAATPAPVPEEAIAKPPLNARSGHANGQPKIAAPAVPLQDLAKRPFEGQVALVSGSGRGLGKVIATKLAGLGAHVIVNSFHSGDRGEATANAIAAEFGAATHLWGSFASRQHIDRIFDEIESRFGRLDFYVHNASDGAVARLQDVSEEHWENAFRTNIVGYHLSAMRAAKLMKKSGGGRIVSMSSPGARRYLEFFGCLGPVKAAVESLTLYLAQELAPLNVQVNAVSAGPVYGDSLRASPEADKLIPYWENLSADNRLSEPEEIADAVVFLLSNAARKINGSVLLVDGAASQRM